MGDYGRSLRFGVIVNADARGYEEASALVRRANEAGLDLLSGSSVNKSPADVAHPSRWHHVHGG
jgi:hypothetical protein